MVKSHLSKTRKIIDEARANPRKRSNIPIVDDRGGQDIPSGGHDIPPINDPSHLEYEEMLSIPIQHDYEVMGYVNPPSKPEKKEIKNKDSGRRLRRSYWLALSGNVKYTK